MPADPAPSLESADALLQGLLLRTGTLNYVWTNTESLLIHLIAGLGGMTKDVAMVIFLTVNTTRARLELVDRLAKLPCTPPDQRKAILALTQRFQKEAPLRNKYNHCIYSFDPTQGTVSTILMRIADRKDDLRIGRADRADADELAAIDASISRIQALNLDIWQAIKRYGYPA
ncbi:hypothetical protein [Tabrizicola sp.]|uniref:hypothetical protein n=1 Tax=Tabrizicola sp. TaxID=2005166 RepID=UPI003F2D41E8